MSPSSKPWARRLCSIVAVCAAAAAPVALAAPAHAVALSCSSDAGTKTMTVDAANYYYDQVFSVVGGLLVLTDGAGAVGGAQCGIPINTVNTINVNADGNVDDWVVDLASDWTGENGTDVELNLPVGSGDTMKFDGRGGSGPQTLDLVASGSPLGFDTDGDATADVRFDGQFQPLRSVKTGSGNDDIDLSGVPQQNVAVVIDSGDGTDHVVGTDGSDNVTGGAGDDTVNGGGGPDIMAGGEGDDHVYGGGSGDVLHDDPGADTLDGDPPGTSDAYEDTVFVGADGYTDTIGHPGTASDRVVFLIGPVSASLDSVANDGMFGEDNLLGATGIQTFGGDDTIAGAGFSFVDTGTGDDTLSLGVGFSGSIAWLAGAGTDTLNASAQTGALLGSFTTGGSQLMIEGAGNIDGGGFEVVRGGSGADNVGVGCDCVVEPGPGNDAVSFTSGGRYVAGATPDGADTVTVAADSPAVTADYSARTNGVSLTVDGDANDGAVGENDALDFGITTLIGGAGSDTIVGSSAADTLRGGNGADVLSGRGGRDRLEGGASADSLSGGSGDDAVLGQGGSDKLTGGDGDDVLRGDDANDGTTFGQDVLDGGNGDDDEFGYAGNDTFNQGAASNGSDLLAGGTGIDTTSYVLRSTALKLSLNGRYDDGATGEGDRLGSDIENLTGGKGADLIVGGPTANLLLGGAGNDNFQTVGGGTDNLNGGSGTDKAHRDTVDKVTSVENRY